ncbi:uncharacterized protein [Linepithema humile]|uniref:uncharacterized protein n=1 Tax=Linepithema humile TaxID=83485 RepID=UPI00351F1614
MKTESINFEKTNNSKRECNSKNHINVAVYYGNTSAMVNCGNMSEINNETAISTKSHDYGKNIDKSTLSDKRSDKNVETNMEFSETDCQKEMIIFTTSTRDANETEILTKPILVRVQCE